MAQIDILIAQVAALTNAFNGIYAKARKTDEFAVQSPMQTDSLIRVEDAAGVSKHISILDILNKASFQLSNKLLYFNGVTISGNTVTLLSGTVWRIDNVVYSNITNIPFIVPYVVSVGDVRKDLILGGGSNTDVTRVQGSESDVPLEPVYAIDKVILCELIVTNTTISFANAFGSGVKYPTVDAVSLGLDSKNGVYFPMPFIDNFKTSTKSTNILVIGDSNYADPDRMMLPFLRNLLKYKQTNGIGFFSLSLNAQTMGISSLVQTGTWTDKTIFAGGVGMDGKSAFSNTVTSAITVTPDNITIPNIGFANEIKVLYKKGSAGTLEIATDGVTFTDYVLSTTVAGDLGVITIPLTLSNTWTLRIRLKTGQVELVGAIASNNSINGIKLHKSASSGASTADFSPLSNSALWKQNVALINPDIILIGLTTNDVNQGLSIASIKSNLTNIYNNIRSLNKNSAIFFVIPPRNNYTLIPVTATTYDANSRAINDIAVSLGAGTVPLFQVWDKYPKDYTDTLFNDGIHYNTAGSYVNSELLSKYLSLSNLNGIVGEGSTNFLAKFKDGILTQSNIFNDGVNIGFGTSVPSGEFSFKNRIVLNDGSILWGNTGTNGVLSWDTGKAIVKSRTGNVLTLGTEDYGENITLGTTGGVKMPILAGTATRLVVADASGNLSATLDFAANVSQPEASRLSIASTNIIGWGDSLTAGAGGGGTTYLSTLNFLTKFNVTNNGVGGETSTQIKDRFLANTADFDKTVIIWAGRNNYTDPITVKADIATMVANLTHTRYLVISVLNGNGEGIGTSNYNTIIQLNNDLKAIYGKKYLDLRAYLVSLHNSTAQDLLDYANDIPPTSLRSDGIHLNTQGYTNVGEFFNKNLGVLFEKEGYLQSKDFKYYFENYSPLHSISDESFTGVKTATNTGTTQVNGINLVNNGTTSTARSLSITNNYTGYGSYFNNVGSGYAIGGNNASSGRFLYFTNTSTGFGSYITNSSTGIGQYLNNTGSGQGIRADNAGSGYGFYSNNTGAGLGAYFLNSSTGIANVLNSATASTGDLLQFQKNGVVKSYVNNLGEIHAQTPTAGTNTTQVATTAFVQSATRPYKVYTALISQIGTSDPTAIVLENTLGGTVVLSYVSVGTYNLTLTGGFNINKTTVFLTKQYNSSSNIILSGSLLSTNAVRIMTSNNTDLQDAQLSGASIEIRVYP